MARKLNAGAADRPRSSALPALRFVLAALALCACVGCAGMQLTHTGFLKDDDALQPAPEREVFGVPNQVLFHERSGVDWNRYRTVFVEPTAYLETNSPHAKLGPEEQAMLCRNFDEILRRELVPRFEVVDTPHGDSVIVRAAITDVETQLPWWNWVTLVLIVPTSMGGISGEMEVLDGVTNERLLAMIATREGTPFLLLECFSRFGHAEHGMLKWARELRDQMTPVGGVAP